ncbi:hypothetical protein [Sphingomonas aracearum]|uniref:Uncharacterized protein n=1 Tax=Sphingomonas aracearum TaxID=2283317 RepID=A0A369VSV2_9SPHN|nr:hypothetical protein [Sphingomonas aracearum]RDE04939.1 hypothetical protein DVW87_15360 [Sphingomonas aracearum]
MDLSFFRFEAEPQVTALPPDLAVMLVGVAARQAVSPTARVQALLTRPVAVAGRFCPADGAFNGTVAAMLRRSSGSGDQGSERPVNPLFTEPL